MEKVWIFSEYTTYHNFLWLFTHDGIAQTNYKFIPHNILVKELPLNDQPDSVSVTSIPPPVRPPRKYSPSMPAKHGTSSSTVQHTQTKATDQFVNQSKVGNLPLILLHKYLYGKEPCQPLLVWFEQIAMFDVISDFNISWSC